MIKAVILDVDGVVKGSKEGVNFPLPHPAVIEALKKVRASGIPIILCSGNYYRSILSIVELAYLNNPHIADRGAFVFDPLDKVVIERHCLGTAVAKKILHELTAGSFYLEVYTDQKYYVQKDALSAFTKKRAAILQQEPVIVSSLALEVSFREIIKINVFSNSEAEKQKINEAVKPFQEEIATAWVGNPAMGTTEAVNIIKKGISKLHAVQVILKIVQVSTDAVLGVGDSMSDWEFMSACTYAAAMGNANDKLKALVKTKGEGNYCIAPHVDDNGLLDVFKYFKLL